MKVSELISLLQKMESDLEVVCITEDENLISHNQLFKLFYVENISVAEGEMVRSEADTPSIKFGKSQSSQKIATIEITSVF